jgi:hypothetical protein
LIAATAGGDFASANEAWAEPWLQCLLANTPNGQDICYTIPAPYIPNYYWTYATDAMSALAGVYYFLTLGVDPEDWRRVWGWMTCKGRRKGEPSADFVDGTGEKVLDEGTTDTSTKTLDGTMAAGEMN